MNNSILNNDKAILTIAKSHDISLEEAKVLYFGIMHSTIGDLDNAITIYDEYLKTRSSSKLLCARGEAFLQKCEYKRAIEDFNMSIKLNKFEKDAYFSRAEVYRETEKYDEAIIDYSEAIKLNKNYSAALNNRGLVFFEQKKYQDAINDYTAVLLIEKNQEAIVSAHENLGDVYERIGKLDMAIDEYTKSLKVNSQNIKVLHKRGLMYIKTGKLDFAINDINKAIELDPINSLNYHMRAGIYDLKGNNNQAIADFSTAIDIDNSFTDVYLCRGNLFFKIGQYDNAIKDYDTVLKLKPRENGLKNAHETAIEMKRLASEANSNKK